MLVKAVFFLGAIHGLALSWLLVTKRVNQFSNRVLGALMLVFSADLAMAAFLGFNLHVAYPFVIGIDYPLTLLYGPLIYLYVHTMVSGSKQLKKQQLLHFLPFALLVLYMIPFYSTPGPEKLALLDNASAALYGWEMMTHFKVIFNLSYLPFVLVMLSKYQKQLETNFSYIELRNLSWLQNFIIGGVILALLAAVFHTLTTLGENSGLFADLTLIAVTIFVYSIGYLGLRQPEVFTDFETGLAIDNTAETHPKSYSKSGLDEETGRMLFEKLLSLMENEKCYRENELSLRELAEKMEISAHNLTEIINRYAEKNFYDFVNSYRVNEVISRMKNTESDKLTILALALESGFNSKSSFNSVFKKHTGYTPSQYRKQLREE